MNFPFSLCSEAPNERLGAMADGFKSVRKHRWFKGLDWSAFHSRQVAVPFVPVFKGEDDTRCAGQE